MPGPRTASRGTMQRRRPSYRPIEARSGHRFAVRQRVASPAAGPDRPAIHGTTRSRRPDASVADDRQLHDGLLGQDLADELVLDGAMAGGVDAARSRGRGRRPR